MAQVPNATILTPAQISLYAQNAGFSGADLQTAVAIALAESGGNPVTYNPETAAGTPDGEGSYGLWQIYLNAHPEFAMENLYDPQTNANAAYSVYSAAGGFSPWSTYGSGAYQAFLSQIPAPAGAVTASPLPTSVNSAAVSEASLVPAGLDTSTILWLGAAVLAGWALLSFLE